MVELMLIVKTMWSMIKYIRTMCLMLNVKTMWSMLNVRTMWSMLNVRTKCLMLNVMGLCVCCRGDTRPARSSKAYASLRARS